MMSNDPALGADDRQPSTVLGEWDAAASGVQSSAISRGIGGTSMAAVAAAAPIASASAASRLSSARGGVVDLPLSGFRRDVLTCFGLHARRLRQPRRVRPPGQQCACHC